MIDYKNQHRRMTPELRNSIIVKFGLKELTEEDLKRDDIKKYIENYFIKSERIIVK